jgi:hypothetical protein
VVVIREVALSARRIRLLALLLLGCRPSGPEPFDGTVELFFRPEVGDSYLSCGQAYQFGKKSLSLLDLHFYVYDVRLVTEDGAEHPVTIADEPPFQHNGWALLDFADGMSPCESDSVLNKTVKGTVEWDGEAADFTGVRFRLGVPPESGGPNVFFQAASTEASVVLSGGSCLALGGCDDVNRPAIALDGYDVANSVIAVDWGAVMNPAGAAPCEPDGCGCDSRCVPGAGVAWTAEEGTSEPAVFRVE